MNPQLSPLQIVAWMRTKANTYTVMADEIEAEYTSASTGKAISSRAPLTEDQLFEAVQKKSGRVVHYAQRLHVSEDEIQRVLSLPNCRVEVGDRGWFKIKDATGTNSVRNT